MSAVRRFYFDWAASAIPENFSDDVPFGNPSSLHNEGQAARTALEDARRRCAAALDVDAAQLYWTSGGSESNALVLFSLLRRLGRMTGGILAGSGEHSSIREQQRVFQEFNLPFNLIELEVSGAVSPYTLNRALTKHPETTMICVMHVNNESGAVSPVGELVRCVKGRFQNERPVHFHSDMVQSLGKVPFSLKEMDVDSASFSAHKIGAPRGIGLLYLKKPLPPLILGGGQERGMRSGTENVAGALAFTHNIERVIARLDENHGQSLMARLIRGLRRVERGAAILPSCREEIDRRFSPYILQTALSGIPGEVLVRVLNDAGFAVSTGSACSTHDKKRPVLEAMGIDPKTAFEAVRISFSPATQETEINALLDAFRKASENFGMR